MQDDHSIDADLHRRLRESFTSGGDRYERLRPSYPAEAVDWLLTPATHEVADIGAGTGKLTRLLAGRGVRAVAIDPALDMLSQIGAGIPTVVGTAEHTGLSDACVDLATFAQSWHWADPLAAGAELARIVRPGGRVAMLWNQLDISVPWLADYTDAAHTVEPRAGWDTSDRRYLVKDLPGFGVREDAEFGWQAPMSPDELAQLAETRSYWLSASASAQSAARPRVAAAVAAAPRQPDGTIRVPYRTVVTRAERLP